MDRRVVGHAVRLRREQLARSRAGRGVLDQRFRAPRSRARRGRAARLLARPPGRSGPRSRSCPRRRRDHFVDHLGRPRGRASSLKPGRGGARAGAGSGHRGRLAEAERVHVGDRRAARARATSCRVRPAWASGGRARRTRTPSCASAAHFPLRRRRPLSSSAGARRATRASTAASGRTGPARAAVGLALDRPNVLAATGKPALAAAARRRGSSNRVAAAELARTPRQRRGPQAVPAARASGAGVGGHHRQPDAGVPSGTAGGQHGLGEHALLERVLDDPARRARPRRRRAGPRARRRPRRRSPRGPARRAALRRWRAASRRGAAAPRAGPARPSRRRRRPAGARSSAAASARCGRGSGRSRGRRPRSRRRSRAPCRACR